MNSEKYAKEYLKTEIRIIENDDEKMRIFSELNIFEKAIIYKYSIDGYQGINESLRKSSGKNLSVFGKLLDKILEKLPNFEGLVYRGLTKSPDTIYGLKIYEDAFKTSKSIIEHHFLSTSREKGMAFYFGRDIIMTIISKKGKKINQLVQNSDEKEVIFRYNTKFEILGIKKNVTNSNIEIFMEEV